MTVDEIIRDVVRISRKYGATEVILYGSRAKGTARERSDIDLAIRGAAHFDLLEEELEEIPTLYQIDAVNLDTIGNPLLREDIEEYGRKIYEKI